jgi:hypothetical protein
VAEIEKVSLGRKHGFNDTALPQTALDADDGATTAVKKALGRGLGTVEDRPDPGRQLPGGPAFEVLPEVRPLVEDLELDDGLAVITGDIHDFHVHGQPRGRKHLADLPL